MQQLRHEHYKKQKNSLITLLLIFNISINLFVSSPIIWRLKPPTKVIMPNKPYLSNIAILFLVFNRPDITKQVFESIRQARPLRLYVASDGPRKDMEGDVEKVQAVRDLIMMNIDWDCEVKTLFRDQNLGLKYAVSEAITWFFKYEKQGIILEDDCLPHPDFFPFCQELLEHYKDNEQVSVITGNNFQNGIKRGKASYYFSKYNHCWGWASWRRAWSLYQGNLPFWLDWQNSTEWKRKLPDYAERQYWKKIFDQVYRDEIDSWAYPWTASIWYQGGLTVTPNVNLVSNIGFGKDSTHTSNTSDPSAFMPVQPTGNLNHPQDIHHDVNADRYVFNNHFGGINMRWYSLPRRILRRFASTLKLKTTR